MSHTDYKTTHDILMEVEAQRNALEARVETLESQVDEAKEHLLAIAECQSCDRCAELANHALGFFVETKGKQ